MYREKEADWCVTISHGYCYHVSMHACVCVSGSGLCLDSCLISHSAFTFNMLEHAVRYIYVLQWTVFLGVMISGADLHLKGGSALHLQLR